MSTSDSATNLLPQPQPQPQPQVNLNSRTRVMRTQSQWKALLNEFSDSGLTRSAFCKKHRIATSTFYRWQQSFMGRPDGATDFIDVTQPLSNTAVPAPALVSAHDNDWQVELELGAGIVLRLRTN